MIAKLLLMVVRFYQLGISPFMPMTCRYDPTCSAYMTEAVERFGAFKGFFLGLRRVLRCHPFARGPHQDPVPEVFAWPGIFGYKRGKATPPEHSSDGPQ